MERRTFIKQSALAGALASSGLPHSVLKNGKKKRPNILFIFTDQQTMRAMSAYGNPYLYTPNMDSLAAHGVRFEKAYCTSPVCGPARSSLVTSRMPHETQVNYNGETPVSSFQNMGQVFRDAGYHTVWCGKWHLPDSYPHAKGLTEIPGFDLIDFLPAEKMSGRGDITDAPCADAAVEFIKNGHDEPFLLGVSLHNPHDICYVPRKYDHFPEPVNMDSAPPLPDNHSINADEPEFIKECRQRNHYGNELTMAQNFTDEQWKTYIFNYYRMTERVDKEIGKVIRALEYMAIEEETLIVLTSDHGDGVASHKWAAKLGLYQEAVNIPMVVTWFGKTPENVCDNTHLVSGLDVLPTMCDYAGIEPPLDILGNSLRPLIEQNDYAWRDYVVTELAPDTEKTEMKGRMLRTKRFKYNLYSHGERNEQLFDLEVDPGETNNLAFDPNYKSVKEKHRKMLNEWMEQTDDDFRLFT